jgi:hypothetical protein
MADELDIHLKRRGQDPQSQTHTHGRSLGHRAKQRHYAERAHALRPQLPTRLQSLGAVGRVVPPPPAGSPQPVVRTTVTTGQRTRGFLHSYLQKGKGQDGAPAQLFGPGVAHLAQFVRDVRQDPHQFRIMVSTPDHAQLDRGQFIDLLMAQVERDLRRPLDWVAAHHYDTKDPHTHIVLRGRDRHGKVLYMDRNYYSHSMRYRASQFLSWFIGFTQTQQQQQQSDRQQADGVVRSGDDPDTRQRAARSQDSGPSVWERLQSWATGASGQASALDALHRQLDAQRRAQEQIRHQQQRGGRGYGG